MRPERSTLFALALVVVSLATAWIAYGTGRLLYLNANAGYYLPNDAEMARQIADGGRGIWRARRIDETTWRRVSIDDPSRPLTEIERAQMEKLVKGSNSRADLREHATIVGCIQYPLTIILIPLLGVMIYRLRGSKSELVLAGVLLTVSVVCLGINVYLGPLRAILR